MSLWGLGEAVQGKDKLMDKGRGSERSEKAFENKKNLLNKEDGLVMSDVFFGFFDDFNEAFVD